MSLRDVLDATRRHWDLSQVLPMPTPGWLQCPICRHSVARVRFWRFHRRERSETTPYRCDVSMKCCSCALVWLHGVVVPESYWKKRPLPQRDGMTISWKQGRDFLKEQ